MDKIKVSHEVPLCLLEESLKFNDYQYCLPHLLDLNEEYKEFFLKVKKEGHYIVMDNSVHELGKPLDTDKLLEWIYKLEPNEFIVPDYFFDKTRSIVEAKHWSKINLPENTIKVAVVQAKTIADAMECYQTYKDLGYKKIAFSYSAEYYAELVPHPNKHLAKALGRIKVISNLFEMGIIAKTDRVHLLGCCVPQEFAWYKGFDFIESLDT
jgi:enolase